MSEDQQKQFLIFKIDEEVYGINLLSIQEVKAWEQPTPLPDTPDYLTGMINLRGNVLPIMDLRKRFHKPEVEVNEKHVVIIVIAEGGALGLIADAVSDILTVDKSEVRPAGSASGLSEDNQYIEGVLTSQEEMVLLLDVKKLCGADLHRALKAS